MNKLLMAIFFVLGFSTQAYGGLWSSSSALSCFENSYNDPGNKSNPIKYAWNSEGVYQDAEGDAIFEFVDLTSLKVTVDDEQIAVTISLTYIPNVLIFNRANVPDDELEYEWSVYFDLDGKATNEIAMSITSYKEQGKETPGSILSKTQHDVWLLKDEGGESVSFNVAATMVDKSTLSLIVHKSEHEALKKITAKTPVRFSASYNFAGKVCEDIYPDENT